MVLLFWHVQSSILNNNGAVVICLVFIAHSCAEVCYKLYGTCVKEEVKNVGFTNIADLWTNVFNFPGHLDKNGVTWSGAL